MKNKIREMKKTIKMKIPYRTYNCLVIGFLVASIVSIVATFYFATQDVEAVRYNPSKEFDLITYYYLKVDDVEYIDDGFYLVENGDYIRIYRNQDPLDVQKTQKIYGTMTYLSDEEANLLLPAFQKKYPDLYVEDVDEMMEYTSSCYMDGNEEPVSEYAVYGIIFSFTFLVITILLKLVLIGYDMYFGKSFKVISMNQEEDKLLTQLQSPRQTYTSLKVMLLDNFIVTNHPSPYVISYDDIGWIYMEQKILNHEIRLVVVDKNNKKKRVVYASSFIPKNKKEFEDLLMEISSQHPEIIVGYNDENREKFNQKYQ